MPNDATVAPWTENERALLDRLLDQIIPATADGRIPAAGFLGVAEHLAARIRADSDLASLFAAGLRTAAELAETNGGALGEAQVKELERLAPVFFAALVRHTYMGYYTNRAVPPLFGLTAKAPQPDGYDVPDEDAELLATLIAPVKNRGQCYRECQGAS